jgi:hypothetical protein
VSWCFHTAKTRSRRGPLGPLASRRPLARSLPARLDAEPASDPTAAESFEARRRSAVSVKKWSICSMLRSSPPPGWAWLTSSRIGRIQVRGARSARTMANSPSVSSQLRTGVSASIAQVCRCGLTPIAPNKSLDPKRSCCRKVFAKPTNARVSAASPGALRGVAGSFLLPHGRCGAHA